MLLWLLFRPFAASHSRGTKPPGKVKVTLGQDKQTTLPFKIIYYVFCLSCPSATFGSSLAVLSRVNGLQQRAYGVFSHDVTPAMLVSQTNVLRPRVLRVLLTLCGKMT